MRDTLTLHIDYTPLLYTGKLSREKTFARIGE